MGAPPELASPSHFLQSSRASKAPRALTTEVLTDNHGKMWVFHKAAGKIAATKGQSLPSQEEPNERGDLDFQTGMSYFAGQFQAPKPMPACSIAAIVARASALTPVLDEILHHHAPPPVRWGIDE
jgi:hypothetical protein